MLLIQRIMRRKGRFMGDKRQVVGPISSTSFDFGLVAKHNLKNTGITLRNALPELDAYGNAIYDVPLQHTRRRERLERRREEERNRVAPIVSPRGIRATTAIAVLFVLGAVLGLIWLFIHSGQAYTYKQINDLERRLAAAQEEYAYEQERYAQAASVVDVSYRAAELGMISTRNMETIGLAVPEGAVMGPMETINGLRVNQLAAITGD